MLSFRPFRLVLWGVLRLQMNYQIFEKEWSAILDIRLAAIGKRMLTRLIDSCKPTFKYIPLRLHPRMDNAERSKLVETALGPFVSTFDFPVLPRIFPSFALRRAPCPEILNSSAFCSVLENGEPILGL